MASSHTKQIELLIPAFQPTGRLFDVVTELEVLQSENRVIEKITIIDDGSTTTGARRVLERLKDSVGIEVLHQAENLGKGAALKTGISHILAARPDTRIIVTADADGQHGPQDILKVATHALTTGKSTLGVRGFPKGIPLRSRFGNLLIRTLFRLVSGKSVRDTQTGLRALVRTDLDWILEIRADRYEFEFQMLFELARHIVPEQVAIKTIYEPGNPTSHFNPFFDSLRIFYVLLRYVSLTAICAILDVGVFSALITFGVQPTPAIFIARIFSFPLYFFGLRTRVFQAEGSATVQFLKLVGLVILNAFLLSAFISWASEILPVHPSLLLVAGTGFLFVANFIIQRFKIFPKPR
jgi:glycosyltransferase involved in cell wall biosynthesis